MKKGIALMMVLGSCLNAQAYRWPLDNVPAGWQIPLKFAENTAHGRHLGTDILLNPGVPIYAQADGNIVISKLDSSTEINPANGYGYYVIIDYHMPDGTERVCGYGHLSRRSGYPHRGIGPVTQGDIIGYVGFDDENGLGGPHTHWFDYGAPYDGTYHYYGYAPNPTNDDVDYDIDGNYVGGKFTDPIKHWASIVDMSVPSNVIGYYQNGSRCQPVIDCYDVIGSVIGLPHDNGGGIYVHDWYCDDETEYVIIQDFFNPTDNAYYAIVTASEEDPAYLLKGGFRYYYMQPEQDGVKKFGAPVSREYLSQYYPVVDGQFDYTAPLVSYFRQDFAKGKFLLWRAEENEILEGIDGAGGSDDGGTVTIATVPLPTGAFELYGAPLGWNGITLHWSDTRYNAQFYKLFCNGWEIAMIAGRAYNHLPLQPNTAYRYQVAAATLSGLIFGYSNEIVVCTDQVQAPPPPDLGPPFPTTVKISLGRTVWAFGECTEENGLCLAGQVFDQYGQILPDCRIVFASSDYNIFSVSGDSGYCLTNGVGSAQVWAEVYDWRGIQSERLNVTVVSELPPEPVLPFAYESCDLRLESEIEFLDNGPLLENQGFYDRLIVGNPTASAVTFWGPQLFQFDLNGVMVGEGSYNLTGNTLQPGENLIWCAFGGYFPPAGDYYLMPFISFTGQHFGQWYAIDQAVDGVSVREYITTVRASDLKPDLAKAGFNLVGEAIAGQPVDLAAVISNIGYADASAFGVMVSIRGCESQCQTFDCLAKGASGGCNFSFEPLVAGRYIADFIIDSDNAVFESDKANNLGYLEFTVRDLPDLVITGLSPTQPEFSEQECPAVSLAVENVGNGAAADCQLTLYSPEDTPLEVHDIPALDPGGSFSFTVTSPSPLFGGNYEIFAQADSGQTVDESNENNNWAQTTAVSTAPPFPPIHISFGCQGTAP